MKNKKMKIINEEDFKNEPSKIIKLNRGGLWEQNEIEIQFDVPIEDPDECNCPHLEDKFIVRSYMPNGGYYDRVYAICPRVIVATNESGYNSTGVCIDCLLEALKELENKKEKVGKNN
jgi:hypothetical protein